jgi:hypothetical protein
MPEPAQPWEHKRREIQSQTVQLTNDKGSTGMTKRVFRVVRAAAIVVAMGSPGLAGAVDVGGVV